MRMDHSDAEPGAGTRFELVPWAATAESRRHAATGPRKRFTYGLARAGLVLAGLGVVVAVTSLVLSGRPTVAPSAVSKSPPGMAPDHSPAASENLLRGITNALGGLKAEVEDLRATVARDRDEAGAPQLARRIDELAARLDKMKNETVGAIAQLAARVDPSRQEAAARLQAVVERLDRLEQKNATEARALNAAPRAPSPRSPVEAPRRPPVLSGWVLRDVYDGLALVEGANGPVEVAPGELLPGAGRVRSIQRSDRGWIVVTSQGVIDSARGRFEP
jgi:hypothetical protein